MGLAIYRSLWRDRQTLARTFAQTLWGPAVAADLPYRAGDVAATVARFHPDTIAMTVTQVHRETKTSKSFVLAPTDGSFPPFEAGQYVNVFATVDGVASSRPYSICSPPTRLGSIEIAVRAKADAFVSQFLLETITPGARLVVSGPAGPFSVNPLRDGDDLVFLAGGSGITPFAAIIADRLERGTAGQMLLLYGSRQADDILFGTRLQRLAADHPRLRIVHVLSAPDDEWPGERGLLDADCLLRHIDQDSMAQKTYFVCGPPAMYRLTLAALKHLGVTAQRIRCEVYGPPEDITAEPGWPADVPADMTFAIRIEGRAKASFRARAGEPLMNSLERAGLVLPALCRTGRCGTCRTRLLTGQVFTPPAAGLRVSDRLAGFIHPCLAYPVSDLTLRLA